MTLETYLYLMVAVLLTIICLAGIMLLVKLSWELVIEPIIDTINNARFKYWHSEYERVRDLGYKWQQRFYKIGIMPDTAERIVGHPRISRSTNENERGNYEVTIKLEITPPEERDGNTN